MDKAIENVICMRSYDVPDADSRVRDVPDL